MNKQEIYDSIVNWQMEAGEDFLDYFDSDLKAGSYMIWCLGRGHITVEQFNLWEEDSSYYSDWASHYVHNCHGEDIPYSVVSEEDWTEEGQEKAYMILAEFISESVTYQKRLKEFLEEN